MNLIELATDSCGAALVRIQLTKGVSYAVLHLVDYERVTAAIGNASWFLNSSSSGRAYVRARDPVSSRNVMIARLVLGASAGRVRHIDGDPLNLRCSNLHNPRPRQRSLRRLRRRAR